MINILRVMLFVIDLLVALAAISGGIALVAGLEPEDRVPISWLEGTPFKSYVIPGLILTVVVGGSATIASFTTYTSHSTGGIGSLIAGGLLMSFIMVEVTLLNQPSPWTKTEIFFFVVGFAMFLLGLVVWQF